MFLEILAKSYSYLMVLDFLPIEYANRSLVYGGSDVCYSDALLY